MAKARIFSTLLLAVALLALTACEPKAQEEKHYDYVTELYAPYLKGDYEGFASHMLSVNDKTDAYRQQVVNMLKQQREITDSLHSGIVGIEVLKVESPAAIPDYASAYILHRYGDGTSEQVILQLIKSDDKWWIR